MPIPRPPVVAEAKVEIVLGTAPKISKLTSSAEPSAAALEICVIVAWAFEATKQLKTAAPNQADCFPIRPICAFLILIDHGDTMEKRRRLEISGRSSPQFDRPEPRP